MNPKDFKQQLDIAKAQFAGGAASFQEMMRAQIAYSVVLKDTASAAKGFWSQFTSLKSAAAFASKQLMATPRMMLSAIRGNIANTGRNAAMGLLAGVVGLGAAASPIGIRVITDPLHEVAAALGTSVLPALVRFGAMLMTTADAMLGRGSPELVAEHEERVSKGKRGAATGAMAAGALLTTAAILGAPFSGGTSLALLGIGAAAGGAAGFFGGEEGPATAARNRRNQLMMLQSMQASLGPAAAIGKIEEADKKAQLAVFEDPMEQRQLEISQQILDMTRNALADGVPVKAR